MDKPSTLPLSTGAVITLEFCANMKCVINSVRQGGMGTVYEIVPVVPAFPMALKTIRANADAKAFEKECEIWLSLTAHPNVARARAYGSWRGHPSILIDWYPKCLSYFDVIDWPTSDLIALSKSLIDAMDFSFKQVGLVHQDIKPSNILLDDSRQPYLSDFGVSRCLASSSRELPDLTRLNAEMNQTVATQAGGGTPLYMAPELFSGQSPSLQTDIFSLGVTLYEVLTGEHPYLGGETAWRFSRNLRSVPLDRVVARRGQGVAPLVQLIVKCLALNPEDRPGDYTSLLYRLDQNRQESMSTDAHMDVIGVVARAKLFREQRRYVEASQLLRDHLDVEPNEPCLLNALGLLHLAEGNQEGASVAFQRATNVLIRIGGKWRGTPFLDPTLNLVNQLVGQRRFQHADDLMGSVLSWTDTAEYRRLRCMYFEFGWMWLFRGEFTQCIQHLMHAIQLKSPDKSSLMWLTEAAWLAGQLDEVASRLCDAFIALHSRDVPTLLCGCLAAKCAPPQVGATLLGMVDNDISRQIAQVEQEAGLPIGALRPPSIGDAERLIVLSVDHAFTGGEHFELIESNAT